jgi:hypothetical protein
MTVKRAKIQIDVEATTEGAVRGMDRVADATDKSRKAVEKNSAALKAAKLEYDVAAARAKNYAERQRECDAAVDRATDSLHRQREAFAKLDKAGPSAIERIAKGAVTTARAIRTLDTLGTTAAAIAEGVADLAHESLEVQGVFANLPYSLNAAREATRGLADNMTLARFAIMANQGQVATTGAAYGEFVGLIHKLSFKLGRDLNDSIERVTLGVAKQERELVDELLPGLIGMEEMWLKYARAQGKAVDELTDAEKNIAFTTEVMEQMRKATQGVEVDMGGAAAAIAKTTVELKNLKTAALGGVEAQTEFGRGVLALDARLLRLSDTMGSHRRDYYELIDALEQAGVNTEKYRNNQALLARDIEKVLEREGDHLVKLAQQKKLTAEHVEEIERVRAVKGALSVADEELIYRDLKRLDLEMERERVAGRAAAAETIQRKERLLEIEEQLAFGRGAQISQGELNKLVAEEAELRALVLEAEGKVAEAAEVRRKAQLQALENEGEMGRRRGGGRRDNRAAEERARRQQELAEMKREAWEYQQVLQNALRAKRAADRELLEGAALTDVEAELGRVIDFEAKRAEVTLNARLREIEAMRAAGVDPVQLIERENEARLEAIAAQEATIQRKAERELEAAMAAGEWQAAREIEAQRELDLLGLQDQREAQLHDAHMARLEARRAAEEATHERRVKIAEESMDLALGAAQAIVQGAVIEGKALRGVVAATAKSEAMRHGLVLGPSALAAAGFHFAIGNIPQATALVTAAGQSFAFAAAMAALGGAVGAFGGASGRGKSVDGFGVGAFGGAGPAANEAPRSASGAGWDIGVGVPLSLETKRKVSSQAASWSGNSPVVVHATTHLNLLGQPDDHTMLQLEKAQMRTAQRVGRLAAGGRG